MSAIIRTDLTWVFLIWAVLGHTLWVVTPWLDPLQPLLGPVWLWCGLVPGLAWTLLYPRRLAGALAAAFVGLLLGLRLGISMGLSLILHLVLRSDYPLSSR